MIYNLTVALDLPDEISGYKVLSIGRVGPGPVDADWITRVAGRRMVEQWLRDGTLTTVHSMWEPSIRTQWYEDMRTMFDQAERPLFTDSERHSHTSDAIGYAMHAARRGEPLTVKLANSANAPTFRDKARIRDGEEVPDWGGTVWMDDLTLSKP